MGRAVRLVGFLLAALLAAGTCEAQSLRPIARPRSGFNLGLTSTAYDADTVAYFNTAGRPSDQGQAYLFDTMVRCLKSGNGSGNAVWATKLGGFFIFASWSQQAALTDVVRPAHTASAVNSPTFVINRGIGGDGATSYVDLMDTWGSGASLYTQNAGSLGAWAPANSSSAIGSMTTAAIYAGGAGGATRSGRAGSNSVTVTGTAGTSPNFVHVTVTRPNASTMLIYDAGAPLASASAASVTTGIGTQISSNRRNNTAYGSAMIRAVYYGALLSDADVAVIDACERPYLTNIGATSYGLDLPRFHTPANDNGERRLAA